MHPGSALTSSHKPSLLNSALFNLFCFCFCFFLFTTLNASWNDFNNSCLLAHYLYFCLTRQKKPLLSCLLLGKDITEVRKHGKKKGLCSMAQWEDGQRPLIINLKISRMEGFESAQHTHTQNKCLNTWKYHFWIDQHTRYVSYDHTVSHNTWNCYMLIKIKWQQVLYRSLLN